MLSERLESQTLCPGRRFSQPSQNSLFAEHFHRLEQPRAECAARDGHSDGMNHLSAFDAQLRAGDILLEVEGQAIADLKAWQGLAQQMVKARRPLMFRVLRRGSATYVAVDPTP